MNQDKDTLKRLYIKLKQTEEELARLKQRTEEPLALVGAACRLPGGANTPSAYWQMISEQTDAISLVPEDRWDREHFYNEDASAPGTMYTREGGFLDTSIRDFDNTLFGISPREARALDPQQRLLLECAWEALESAGLDPLSLQGARMGVYVGISSDDYKRAHSHHPSLDRLDAYSITGVTFSTASGRLSYFFGLEGPAVSVDTACSSSLVTLHMAATAIRGGECDAALVAGVNLMLTPAVNVAFTKLHSLSPGGRSKSFDASADGYGRGEGCGVLILKRLSDAQAAGDTILALVRGTALNQDGRSSNLTAPNGNSQVAVMHAALKRSGLLPSHIDYIEAHGTGTPLGDPIEMDAIAKVYADGAPREHPIAVGSVKANIGHLEAAAGVASILKAALALSTGVIPGQVHFHTPNPLIDWDRLSVTVSGQTRPWPARQEHAPRRAGVSAFGFSGTNAHIILEQAPVTSAEPCTQSHGLIAFSARTPEGLRRQAGQYAELLRTNASEPGHAGALMKSVSSVRTGFELRAAVSARSAEEMIPLLEGFALGSVSNSTLILDNSAGAKAAPAVLMQFTGQGSQYAGMGRELYEVQDVYRTALQRVDGILQEHLGGRSIIALMHEGPEEELALTQYAQPAIFALQYAQLELWRHYGVVPDAVLGHSVGEFAAAVAAGVFSLEDAARLIALRGRLLGSLQSDGMMAAVFAPERLVAEAITRLAADVSIAAVNAPGITVVSGRQADVAPVLEALQSAGRKHKRLAVSSGFHSAMTEPVLEEFAQGMDGVSMQAPQLPFYSTVLGRRLSPQDMVPGYWVRHIRDGVRYMDAVRSAAGEVRTYDVFLELGPAATLTSLAAQCIEENVPVLCASASGKPETQWSTLSQSIARLYIGGASLNWSAITRHFAPTRVELPPYPFERKRFWMEPECRISDQDSAPAVSAGEHPNLLRDIHPLAGSRIETPHDGDVLYVKTVHSEDDSYLFDHRIHDVPLVPATGHIEIALAVGEDLLNTQTLCIEDVLFMEPLLLADGETTIITRAHPLEEGAAWRITVSSRTTAANASSPTGWKRHSEMTARATDGQHAIESLPATPVSATAATLQSAEFYACLATVGYTYGTRFQGVREVRYENGISIADINVDESTLGDDYSKYRLHPATLDICFHSGIATFLDCNSEGDIEHAFIPVGVERIRCFAPLRSPLRVYQKRRRTDDSGTITADIGIFDSTGALCASITGIMLREVAPEMLRSVRQQPDPQDDLLYELSWERVAGTSDGTPVSGTWLVIDELKSSTAAVLKQVLMERGAQSVTESAGDDLSVMRQADGIIVLYTPDVAGTADDDISLRLRQWTVSTLRMLQYILKEGIAAPVYFITRGAQSAQTESSVSGVITGLEGSAVIALIHGALAENPLLPLYALDLPALKDDARLKGDIELIVSRCAAMAPSSASDESFLALRNGIWLARRIVHAQNVHVPAIPQDINIMGAFLITGGLGALGLMSAQWLTRRGARSVVLCGRTPARTDDPRLKTLADSGVHVTTAACDLSNYESVEELLRQFGRELPPLSGIIHAAGILDDVTLEGLTPERLHGVLAPKALGAWNLHRAMQSQGHTPDFMIMYSSAAALFGSPGQANYMTANSVLDHLAHQRNHLGLAALSINWGPWASGGMAAEDDRRGERLSGMGMQSIEPQQCFAALDRILGSTACAPQYVVAAIEWERFAAALPQRVRQGFLRHVITSDMETPEAHGASTRMKTLLEEVAHSPAAIRQDRMEDLISEMAASVLGYDAAAEIQRAVPLSEQGFDSLLSVEMRNALAALTGVSLPASLLFDYPTVGKIAHFLTERLYHTKEAKSESPLSSGDDALLRDIEDLLQQ